MYDTKCIFSAHITCMMHLPTRHRTGVKLSVARNEKKTKETLCRGDIHPVYLMTKW